MALQARDYAAAAASAEEAVKSIKDPELRRVAFQKILEDILASGSSGPRQPARGSVPAAASPRPTKKRGGPQAGGAYVPGSGMYATLFSQDQELSHRH